MNYSRILSRAWQIVWKNKGLILLGFLIALGGGAGSGGSGGGGGGGGGSSNFGFRQGEFQLFFREAERFLAQYGAWLILLGLFFLVLGIVFWLLRLVAEAGLIDGVDRADKGEAVGFGDGFRAGVPFLGRVVGLNLLLYGPLLLAGIVGAIVGLATLVAVADSRGGGVRELVGVVALCVAPLACMAGLYSLVVTFVYPFSVRSLVLQRQGIAESVRRGWRVLTGNLGDIIVLGLIFLVLSILVGVVVAIFAVLPGLAAMLPAILELVREGSVGGGRIALAAFGALLLTVIGAIVSSLVLTYRSAVFTLAYREFTGEAPGEDLPAPELPAIDEPPTTTAAA